MIALESPEPFPHLVSFELLERGVPLDDVESRLASADWKEVVESFYEQGEIALDLGASADALLGNIVAPENIARFHRHAEKLAGRPLGAVPEVTIHRLRPGQSIRIHNDWIDESVALARCVVHLNTRPDDAAGGELVLFSADDPESAFSTITPVKGLLLAFAISPQSHHAVLAPSGWDRYTVIFTFTAQ